MKENKALVNGIFQLQTEVPFKSSVFYDTAVHHVTYQTLFIHSTIYSFIFNQLGHGETQAVSMETILHLFIVFIKIKDCPTLINIA